MCNLGITSSHVVGQGLEESGASLGYLLFTFEDFFSRFLLVLALILTSFHLQERQDQKGPYLW